MLPSDYSLVSWRYLVGVLEIFHWFPGDIWWMFCRYLIGVLEIFDWCSEDFLLVS